MRATVAIVVAALGAAAHASYDLMFIPTTGTNAQLRRYDPVNFVSLGFVGSASSPTASAASLSDGIVAMGGMSSRLSMYDYSTNTFIRSLTVQAVSLSFNSTSTQLLGCSNLSIWSLNIAASTATLYSLGPMTTARSIVGYDGTRFFVVGQTSSGAVMVNAYNIGTTTPVATLWSNIGDSSTIMGQAAYVPNRSEIIGFSRTGSPLAYYRFTVSGGALNGYSSGTPSDPFQSTSVPSVVPAHGGFYAVGQDISGTSVRVAQYDNVAPFTTIGGATFSGTWTNGFQPSIVLAPEPASLAALGLGALALIRRRRTSRKGS